tara:strand:- start:271 stop:1380 length:1110 start_codon:yes stop_codon:yes gene_type:complete
MFSQRLIGAAVVSILVGFSALACVVTNRKPNTSGLTVAAQKQVTDVPPPRTAATNARYIASPIEAHWLASPKVGKICQTSQTQTPQNAIWTNYSKKVFYPVSKPYVPMTDAESEVMSYIFSNGHMQPIEPLSGVGRHPSFCQGNVNENFLFDISYLIPQNECIELGTPRYPKQKKIYFDLGCTMFGSLKEVPSGTGPSIPLFIDMYKQRCVNFDEVYGWEGTVQNPATWWKNVPVEWRHKVHFYNVFVEEESYEATHANEYRAEKSDASFLKMLPLVAKESDLVVLKVDIDGGPELQIVETIANRPDLYILIDEMYFEYHYWYDGREFGWPKTINDGAMTRSATSFNVDHALALFDKLRRVGIRGHFWI